MMIIHERDQLFYETTTLVFDKDIFWITQKKVGPVKFYRIMYRYISLGILLVDQSTHFYSLNSLRLLSIFDFILWLQSYTVLYFISFVIYLNYFILWSIFYWINVIADRTKRKWLLKKPQKTGNKKRMLLYALSRKHNYWCLRHTC